MGNQLYEALKALGLISPNKRPPAEKPKQLTRRDPNPPAKTSRAGDTLLRTTPSSSLAREQENSRSPVKIQPRLAEPNNDLTGTQSISSVVASRAASEEVAARSERSSTVHTADFKLENVDEFQPHHLFQILSTYHDDVAGYSLFGVQRQLSSNPQDETDLIIGLDFGTSSTKVVVRDVYAGNVFPVEFNPNSDGLERFLQASSVCLDKGVFKLSGEGEQLDDLKLALLDCKAAFPVTEFNRCCAFLALTIRKARGWFLEANESIYRHHKLNWFMNVGLAASSYQDDGKVQLFRRLAWAAANLAADTHFPQISENALNQYRSRSISVFSNPVVQEMPEMEFLPGDVGVIPEVAAQIQGFMTSARWDWKNRPIMMIVDVGAGTVDTALFHVNPTSRKLTFYSSRVESNGAMNLHRERVAWLLNGLPNSTEYSSIHSHLESIALPTGRIKAIPSAVSEYLPGCRIQILKNDVDSKFQVNRYRAQVAGSINAAKLYKGLGVGESQQLRHIPLLLCGGGSRLSIYSTIESHINGTLGSNVSVEKTLLPVPIGLGF